MALAPHPRALLHDGQGRRVTYLRLSLTRRCNFRCSYCSPHPCAVPQESVLDRDELRRLVEAFAGLGVRRVRLTGGEPTLRRDLCELVRDVGVVPGIEEIALTTNGQLLEALAPRLREAGVSRVNVSLDTLRPERLQAICGRAASLGRIVGGIEAAVRAGFASVKLNAVVLRGVNEDELGAIVRFAWSVGVVPRFIELMPFGRGEPVPLRRIRTLLRRQGVVLGPADSERGWGPASYHLARTGSGAGATEGLVGFIGAMTGSFCSTCNRVRVGPDGALRPCLGGREEVPLRHLLRPDVPRAELEARIREALLAKASRHRLGSPSSARPPPMSGIGG